jgi:SAM-dependent methyltransferase
MIDAKYTTAIQYQNEIYHIATRIFEHKSYQDQFRTRHGLKRLSNAVVALDKNSYYEIYPPVGYYLTDKADGVRCVISAHDNKCVLLTSADCRIIDLPADAKNPLKEVVLDCEMLGELANPTLYVFDCMVWGTPITGGFADRLAAFDDAIAYIAELTKLNIQSKRFVKLGVDLEKSFRSVYEAKYPYSIDGLILTEPGKRYTDTRNYKWKSYDHNTIDFLAIKCSPKLMGVKPYIAVENTELYILFVGIDNQYREKLGVGFMHGYKQLTSGMIDDGNYVPIQFSPSAAPLAYIYYHQIDKNADPVNLDGKIIELRRNADNTKWEFLRIREDRKLERGYYGNDFRIAELTFMNYVDRFDFTALWQENVGYFTKTASTIHTAPNRFKRFVISDLLKNQLAGSNWVIDEASGRGADIHRYQEIGVKNALFIEIDPTAVAELIRRKFEYANRQQQRKPHHRVVGSYDSIHGVDIQKVIDKDNKNLTCNVMVGDLKTAAATMLQRIADFGIVAGTIDGIVCNFALHYMCDTVDHIRNLLAMNATLLKQGGLFMFTVMDGSKIFNLLADGDYKSYQDDVLKYSIKKLYKADKLTGAGQMISVLMPFSDKHYDEPLCNIDFVISEAAKLGFAFELNESFSSYFSKFTSADKLLGEQLTDADRKYIDLYHFITLRLVKKPKV